MWVLSLFWVFWAFATVFFTALLTYDAMNIFLWLWLPFGYLGVLGLGYYLMVGRRGKEWFRVVDGDLHYKGCFKKIVIIERRKLRSVYLGNFKYEMGEEDEDRKGEVWPTLNILYVKQKPNLPKRINVGNLIYREDLAVIFKELCAFFRSNNFDFEMINEIG